MRVAKAWGLTPVQWRAQSVDDRADMLAFEMFEGVREAYREEWRERKRETKSGANEFLAMKKRKGLE